MSYYRRAGEFIRQNTECPCRFSDVDAIARLGFRPTPYWHTLLKCRHIGIHRPDDKTCNWTARFLSKDKLYKQKCLGPALNIGRGCVPYRMALARALEWFASGEVMALGSTSAPVGRTREVTICPIGDVYTVGHAMRDYSAWTRLARSAGGHYNNLVLINYHLVPKFANLALEEFSAIHLRRLAQQVLETPPKRGFMPLKTPVAIESLSNDQLRRRKRTFNSLVTILRMAFRQAWENGEIQSERPWRCLRRIPVNHSPRTIFLDRMECRRLLATCGPALRDLVLAALYTGCRVGELGELRVGDVGEQIYGIRVEAFKRSPARFVFLPDEGMAFFLLRCRNKTSQERVLVSDRGKPWRRQHTQLFRRAVARAGLPSNLVFHGLRHTYASDLVRRGVPIDIVAKQLGHANSITVSNTYGHLAEQYREEQIRASFSPLDKSNCIETRRQRRELETLRKKVQTGAWRDYAALGAQPSLPRKTYGSPAADVLEIFAAADELVAENQAARNRRHD